MAQLSSAQRLLGFIYRRAYSPLIAVFLRRRGVQVGRNVIFYGQPDIQMAQGSTLIIGDGCVLCSHAAFTAMGVNRPVTLRTLLPGALLRLNRDVGASGVVICAAQSVEIGAESLLGSGCLIVDTDFHPVNPIGRHHAPLSAAVHRSVSVGSNVFIGAGAFICKGVTLGNDSVVGAMSVVVKNVSAGNIVAGNPAKIVRSVYAKNEASSKTVE